MRMNHGQRMTALLIAQSKVTLEIHLPELVRSLLFKSLIRAHGLVRRVLYPLMTRQDRMHRAFGQRSLASSFETRFDLTRAPAVLITNGQHLLFDGWLAAPRRMLRPARAIGQTRAATISIATRSEEHTSELQSLRH